MADVQAKDLPYLTPAELLAYQQGKMSEFSARTRNFNREPMAPGSEDFIGNAVSGLVGGTVDYLSEKPLIERPLFGLGEIGPKINQGVQALKKPNPDSLRVVNNAKQLVGNTLDLPADRARAGYDKIEPVVSNAVDAVTMTERDYAERAKQQQISAALADETDDGLQQQRIAAFDQAFGASGAGQPQIIGPAPSGGGGGINLPLPPRGPDFSGVQDAIDKTKPVWDEAGMAERKKGAILTGLVGGMLKAAIDGEPVFESAGLGTLRGMSVAGEDRKQTEETFKKALDTYWLRTADVRKATAESDADYADRVWQTRVQQLKINANAAQAAAARNNPVLRQSGDKFFVEETVNGNRQIRPLDMGMVNSAAGMERNITNLVGDEKKAKSIVQEIVARKDPTYGMPAIVTARMKNNGSYIEFVKILGAADPDWEKSFNSVGSQASTMMDESAANDMADKRRDAMIIDILLRDATARQIAYKLTGMDEQYLQEKQKQKSMLPTVK